MEEFEKSTFEAFRHFKSSQQKLPTLDPKQFGISIAHRIYNPFIKQRTEYIPVQHLNYFSDCHTTTKKDNNKQLKSSSSNIPILNFGVALSGGSDSISLLMLLKQFLEKHKEWFQKNLSYTPQLHAFHVDHRIREESQEEAKQIQEYMNSKGILCSISHLDWESSEGVDPKRKFSQNYLRNKRYEKLQEQCSKAGVQFLFLGHNFDDQVATFVMRLGRNSNLTGLQGMKPSSVYSKNLYLIRPLLEYKKQRIKLTCKENGWKWWEDQSNRDPKYTRNYIQHEFDRDEPLLFDLESLYRACLRLNKEAEAQISEIIHRTTKFCFPLGAFYVCRARFLEKNKTLQMLSISSALRMICESNFSTALLHNLLDYLSEEPSRKKYSIGGCLVENHQNYFIFYHFPKMTKPEPLHINTPLELGKWVITAKAPNDMKLYISQLNDKMWGKLIRDPRTSWVKALRLPRGLIGSMFVIVDSQGTITAVPQLTYYNVPNLRVHCVFGHHLY